MTDFWFNFACSIMFGVMGTVGGENLHPGGGWVGGGGKGAILVPNVCALGKPCCGVSPRLTSKVTVVGNFALIQGHMVHSQTLEVQENVWPVPTMIRTSGLDNPITDRLLTRSKISPTLSPARSAADPHVTSFTNGGTGFPSAAKSKESGCFPKLN